MWRHDSLKRRKVVLHLGMTWGLLGACFLYVTPLWFPEPWRSFSDIDLWWGGVFVVATLAGPGLIALTIHPEQSSTWRRDIRILVALQIGLVGILLGLMESSRPIVSALASGDWIFIKKGDSDANVLTPRRDVVIIPTKQTLEMGWEKDVAAWAPVTPITLKNAGRWDLKELDREWSQDEEVCAKWEDVKRMHPNWQTLGAYPVYGMRRSGWWLWNTAKATPVVWLDIPAPLEKRPDPNSDREGG